MALDPYIAPDVYEKLPADVKKEYLPEGNEYRIDLRKMEREITDPTTGVKQKAIFALENVHGLRTALQQERADKETAQKIANSVNGLDISKAKQALIDVETMKTWTSDDKLTAKMKERDQQLEQKHADEMKPLNDKLSRKQAQLEKVLIENAAVVALTTAGVQPHGIRLLLPHVKSFIKLEENADGEVVTKVVDERGIARVSLKANNTGPMDISELVEDMKRKPEYAPAFPGSGSTGSGSTSNSGRTGGSNGEYIITAAEMADFPTYTRKKAEAKAAGRTLRMVE